MTGKILTVHNLSTECHFKTSEQVGRKVGFSMFQGVLGVRFHSHQSLEKWPWGFTLTENKKRKRFIVFFVWCFKGSRGVFLHFQLRGPDYCFISCPLHLFWPVGSNHFNNFNVLRVALWTLGEISRSQ